MFTPQEQQAQKRKRKDKCCDSTVVKCRPCAETGLGAETQELLKSTIAPGEYAEVSKQQESVIQAMKMAASVALTAIPVVGWAAAILINIPVVGDALFKFGLRNDPILKAVLKAFKKATPMENCMNGWKYPEEKERVLRGIFGSTMPYPITNEIKWEYKLQRAKELVVPNEGQRRENIYWIFRRIIDQNPDILKYECATRAEVRHTTGTTAADRVNVDQFWADIREAARREEYSKIVGTLGITVAQKQQAILDTRTLAVQFKMPEGVTSVTKGGVLMLDPTKSMNKVVLSSPDKGPTVKRVQTYGAIRL